LPITSHETETQYVICLEGDIDVTSSAEVKRLLINAISSRKEVLLEMAKATDLDITAVQLLWAAVREADKAKLPFAVAGQVAEGIRRSVREIGFDDFLLPLAAGVLQRLSTSPSDGSPDD